jgi:starvation-inducible DNA-binding protein
MSRTRTADVSIDIGISAAERKKISRGLSVLLADSYTLYLMTHNFHWNVTGPQFNSLHLMFMAQYTEQWEVDVVPKATKMVCHLVEAQEATARTARSLFPLVGKAHDQPTADLLTQRLEVHEKTAWMLRSLLAN